MITAFIVDDHIMVLQGLKALLEGTPDISVTGVATSVEEALNNPNISSSDVLILDDRLDGQSGIDACPEIKEKHPDLHIIILTSFMETELVLKAIKAGVNGFLLKELDAAQLCENIRTVASGGTAMPIDQSIKLSELLEQSHDTEDTATSGYSSLSKQEKKISALVNEGLINKEIADQLQLSEQTIKNYMTAIFSKLNIHRRSQLAVLYEKHTKTVED